MDNQKRQPRQLPALQTTTRQRQTHSARVVEMNQPIITKRLYLEELTPRHVTDAYVSWLNNPEVTKYLDTKKTTKAQLRAYVHEHYTKSDSILFSIRIEKTGKPIGTVKIEPIDHVKSTCWVGMMIGDTTSWHQGYGTEIINAITHYAHHHLEIKSVFLGVLTENTNAKKLYEKCGFTTYKILMKKQCGHE
jgi:[ribosomal protein S5]-alanine N-acetyltransferase